MPKYTIRKLRRHELLDAVRLILRSANDLRAKSGRPAWDVVVSEVPSINYHYFDSDPDGNWGAFFDGKIIGYCAALVRGKQWYLGYLFVDPDYQLKGVGRRLLERALEYGKGKVDSHSLCTFPYNEAALALYSSFGMMPTTPIFEMNRKNEDSLEIPATKLTGIEDNSRKALLRINRLEKEIRGYQHPADWEFFARDSKTKIYQFHSGSQWVGYSVTSNARLIAPAGATLAKYLPEIIAETYRLSLQSKPDMSRLWVGGTNAQVYGRLIELGFKIGELTVFLSTKPYGDFSRYCPAHLAMF